MPRDNPAAKRFELQIGDRLAVAEYILTPDGIVFTHTEVPVELEGRGLASKLIKFALDSARERKLSVTPMCQAVAGYIERHPEYQDLLLPTFRNQ
ncbi:N-acetyltransferase [bacterium]|nr:N-acetyltransferase [bacterium]